jgi:molybdopterin molybdotransferase
MSLLPVEEALARILADVEPVGHETVALAKARGRVLAAPVVALRTQPPFDASAMDGFALRAEDGVKGRGLSLVGEAAAGRAFDGEVAPGQTVRIFTGAPVPAGADAVLVQEQAQRRGDEVVVESPVKPGQNIRRRGLDFREGDAALSPPLLLGPRDLALAAAANHPALAVRRRPKLALLATGDEIVPPGSPIGPSQIVASNNYAVAAMAEAEGASVIDLGIAGDDFDALALAIRRARDQGADVLVTIGGASVGEHDLVQAALAREGMELGFWRIAMRPGKPMMHGRLGPMHIMGLPGNPVSAVVCAILFLVPLLRSLLGRRDVRLRRMRARLAVPLHRNDLREDYLRATAAPGEDGYPRVTPFALQDSSMVSVLQQAQCLLVRMPNAPAAEAGEECEIIDLSTAGY